ncbi:MAG TPA: acetoacetate decarboxylase family protein [Gaiellales bacterium]
MAEPWRGATSRGDALDADAAGGADGPFSSPWDAPTVPPFPLGFRDVRILTVCWRTDPGAIDRLLPPPLERMGDVVVAHIYRMQDVDFIGSALECNVMVGARFRGPHGDETGGYSPYLYLDSEVGVVHGREVHGQPKKLATLEQSVRGDLVVGRVERNGIDILTATLPYKQRRADPAAMRAHFDFTENFNYKVVPNIDGTPGIRQLTARRLADLRIDECWTGPCTVELRPNAQAPVFKLPVLEPLDGFLWTCEFTLVAGRVLHDYLAS